MLAVFIRIERITTIIFRVYLLPLPAAVPLLLLADPVDTVHMHLQQTAWTAPHNTGAPDRYGQTYFGKQSKGLYCIRKKTAVNIFSFIQIASFGTGTLKTRV